MRAAHNTISSRDNFPRRSTILLILLAACGGGDSSAPIQPVTNNPAPELVSATPAQLTAGTGAATVTLKGSHFVTSSRAHWNDADRPTTYVDAATLTVALTAADLASPTSGILTVVNPAPGGGTSGLLNMTVGFPTPTIASISPTSTLQTTNSGGQVQIVVTGTGFVVSQSKVMWDGTTSLFIETAVSTSTSLVAYADPYLLATAGTHTLTVVNPGTGGASNAVSFPVLNPVPTITSLSPNPASTQGAFTLTVTGTGLNSASIIQWNGAARPTTFVNGTTLTAAIPASDVATPTTASIVVVNPAPGGGASSPQTLPVVVPPLLITGTLTLPNIALVRDSIRGVVYASITAAGGANANSIVKIDPATATSISSLPVGVNPGAMAMSEDGQFLYVGLLGAPKIVRVDLQTFTKDIEFSLPASSNSGSLYGGDLVVPQGLPRSVVVSLKNGCCSPAYEGVAIYDDSVPRPDRTDVFGATRIVRGPTASAIYGFNDQGYSYFHRMLVTATGIKEDASTQGLLQSYRDIEYENGRVFGTDGAVIDEVAMTLLGTIPVSGNAVRPDVANGRVHILSSPTIHTYSSTSYSTRIGIYTNAVVAGNTLVRWGADGLAVGGGSTIVFLRGTQVAP